MENGKKQKIYKIIMLILITAVITFMVTSVGMYNYFVKMDETEDTQNIARKFEKVREKLYENYIGDLDEEAMAESALKGYVEGVDDKYTEYLTKDEYEDLIINVTGDYVGIGVYMYQDNDGRIVILMPIEGSPAEEAGLQAGDIIVSIEGEKCEEMDVSLASSKIKGAEGTKVEIEILRGTETIKKEIERRTVEIKDSLSKVLDGNIGYIALSTFDEDCATTIRNYLLDFQKQNIESVVIDLRNNTGRNSIRSNKLF